MTNPATSPNKDSKASTDQERTLRPAVDIFEDATGITVMADMPGVTKDKLDIQIDKDSLLIGGDILLDMPADLEPVYADVRLTRYQRSFSLSRELDTEQVEASFKDGVLILRIPKREAHQTRKIQVRAA
jgi:HSP20 family molecular chaperone IbpA